MLVYTDPINSTLAGYFEFLRVSMFFTKTTIDVAIVRSMSFVTPGAMMLMPVVVPAPTEGRRATATAERLARNAAMLFGVPFDDNPSGHVQLSRFDELTLQALAQGAADSDTVITDQRIATATLNRFRPSRKAGALLAGTEVLFAPLVSVFDEVVRTTAFTDSNAPLILEVRAAIWALLVLECYRSQPALFVAAVTARNVQRALAHPWTAYEARGEGLTGDEAPALGQDQPTTLSILDQTIAAVAADDIDTLDSDGAPGADVGRPRRGEGASKKFLREDLISRWLKHVLDSPDRGFAWITPVAGVRRIEAFISPLGCLNAFIDEIAATELPLHDMELMLPRIPSAGELRRLSPTAQRVTIWVILQVHRMLRDNVRFNPASASPDDPASSVKLRVISESEQLVALAEAVLSPDDPLVFWARAKWRNKVIAQALERDSAVAIAQTHLLREDIEQMKTFARSGIVDQGSIAEFVRSLSPIINSVADDAKERGDNETSAQLRHDLADDWRVFFDALEVDPHALLAASESSMRHALPVLLAGHLHNYAGFLSRSEDDGEVEFSVLLQRDAVIPARREASRQHGTTTGLRVALQVLVRALCIQHDRTDSHELRRDLARQTAAATAELVAVSAWALTAEGSLRSGQVNTLTSIVTGVVIASEHGIPVAGVDLDTARHLAERAHGELQRRRSGGETFGRLKQLARLRARLGALSNE